MKLNSIYSISLVLFFFAGFHLPIMGQTDTSQAYLIRQVMAQQETAWNEGNIIAFMEGYRKSDSLLFVGSSGVQYGFENTLKRYQTTYATPEKMGKLTFQLDRLMPVGDSYYYVLGRWHLARSIGDAGGYFTLLFRIT